MNLDQLKTIDVGDQISVCKFFLEFVKKPKMNAVELGTYEGRNCVEWVPILKENSGKLILVDNFKGAPSYGGPHGWKPEESSQHRSALEANLKNVGFENYVIHEEFCFEAARHYSDEEIDFIYVDGGHDYYNVYQDVSHWWPKLKIGGIMAGDDHEPFYEEVKDATVNDLAIDQFHKGVVRGCHDFFGDCNFDKSIILTDGYNQTANTHGAGRVVTWWAVKTEENKLLFPKTYNPELLAAVQEAVRAHIK